MLAGVSTRKYAQVGEPVGEDVEASSTSTSKSTVSELFIERTGTALGELMSRRLDDVRLAVMMLDGMDIADRTHVVALGISTEGVKIPLGLWEGSTENATLARTLLADLVDRGLDPEQAILFVIDGGKALRRGIKDVFGEHALVHRCHRHKERNVTDLLRVVCLARCLKHLIAMVCDIQPLHVAISGFVATHCGFTIRKRNATTARLLDPRRNRPIGGRCQVDPLPPSRSTRHLTGPVLASP